MNGKRVLKTNRKAPVALVAILVLLCCAVAGTVAFLVTKTDPVVNTFEPSHVTTYVKEEFKKEDGKLTKSDVQIQNTGDIDAYIRVAVIVNWADASGNVYGEKPVGGTNYSELKLQAGWIKVGDYYYYTSAVPAGDFTGTLFGPIQQLKPCEDTKYALQVTILADGIQSEPVHVVADVWKDVKVDGGKLVDATKNG